MNNLIQSLGLDQVEADPNDIPDGRYDGEVMRSEFVLVESKDTIAHVVTFKVTEGQYAGAQRAKWNTLGSEPRDANGHFPNSADEVASYTPTMTDAQKSWYKKMWVDLGTPEQEVGKVEPQTLEGRPVTFGVKRQNGFVNVSFQELRTPEGAAPSGPIQVGGQQVESPFPAGNTEAPAGNLPGF